MKTGEYVTVVGGVNVDITGFPAAPLVPRDSNPGTVSISFGGVGRNIAENLVKLGIHTKLISAIGDDFFGQQILAEARETGLDMEDTLVLKNRATSAYLAVLDEKGDMQSAISDMDTLESLDTDFIKEKRPLIEQARVCVLDTNIPGKVIEYILDNMETIYFLDTVSTAKALKVKDLIGKFHTIKPNKIEAEVLSGMEINNSGDLERCGEYFLSQGVKQVFISLGAQGLYYTDGAARGHIPAHKIDVVNATGAGDAFIAALVYGYCQGYDIGQSAKFAMSASALALSHEKTINPNMSVANVNRLMEGL